MTLDATIEPGTGNDTTVTITRQAASSMGAPTLVWIETEDIRLGPWRCAPDVFDGLKVGRLLVSSRVASRVHLTECCMSLPGATCMIDHFVDDTDRWPSVIDACAIRNGCAIGGGTVQPPRGTDSPS